MPTIPFTTFKSRVWRGVDGSGVKGNQVQLISAGKGQNMCRDVV